MARTRHAGGFWAATTRPVVDVVMEARRSAPLRSIMAAFSHVEVIDHPVDGRTVAPHTPDRGNNADARPLVTCPGNSLVAGVMYR
jgi:hypothetical protein